MSDEGGGSKGSKDAGHDRGGPEARPPDFVVDRLLEHPLRARILDLVEKRPGSNKNQLAGSLDIHPNLLEHHLEKLEDARLLVTRPSAQEREILVFSAEDAELWENEQTRILFGRSQNRNVALFLAENPGHLPPDRERARPVARDRPVPPPHAQGPRPRRRPPTGRTHLYEPHEELESWAERVGSAFGRPWEE